MISLGRPCAAMSMILARITSRYGDVYFRALASSSRRSSTDSVILYGLFLGIPATTSTAGQGSTPEPQKHLRIRHCIYELEYLGMFCRAAVEFAARHFIR